MTKTFTSTALVLTLRELGIPLSTPAPGLLPGVGAGLVSRPGPAAPADFTTPM
ncbi:hypothetical protein [Kribbella italica]|uniref:Uncharacterized protein n=1 Tax=Kribbella italica TaxID=1540520 RepID=A0A7W9JH06_9ACTN|nr:hypothetical protein [Kribbella italica]MBB5841587.1 hypothetical protein [Kribbella italica]